MGGLSLNKVQMRNLPCRTMLLLAPAVAALLFGSLPVWSAQQAGVAAGVVGALEVSEGERGSPEAISSGMNMMLGDRINSEEDSRMQVMLLDETIFTVGPNSDLVIDEFVYSPESGTAKLTANFTKGVMRYVSGNLSKLNPDGVTIKTREATIGVRGTALFIIDDPDASDGRQFIGLLGPGDQNQAGLTPSHMRVTSGGASVDVLRAGYGVFVSHGSPPSVPQMIPQRLLNSMQVQLTGRMIAPKMKEIMKRAGRAQRRAEAQRREEVQSRAEAPNAEIKRFANNRLDKAELDAAAILSGTVGRQNAMGNIISPRKAAMGRPRNISTETVLAKIGPRVSQQRIEKIQRLLDRREIISRRGLP